MSQPFSLSIGAPQRPKLVNASSAVDVRSSASSMSEEGPDFISEIGSSGKAVSVNPKEQKKNYLVLDMDVPEYDSQKSILAQKRVAGLEEAENDDEKYKIDVASRPDVAPLESYNSTPVSLFGDAYLRSLGWIPGEGIGRSNKKVVDVVTFIPRTPGTGLGAKLTMPPDELKKLKGEKVSDRKIISKQGVAPRQQMELPMDADGRVRHTRKLDEELKPVKEAFYKGAPVEIMRGRHSGLKAKVVCRNTHDTLLVLLPSDEKVEVHLHEVEQLDDREVILRRKREAQERKEEEKIRKEEERKRRDERKKREEEDDRRDRDRKRKRDSERDDGRKKSKSNKAEEHYQQQQNSWLRHDICVKIVSKKLGEGKFYCKAGWIVDLLPRNKCVVELDGTKTLLEGIRQEDLETVVPRAGGSAVVLRGERKGDKGKILERDSSRNRLVIQFDEDYDIVTLNMDDVAQYR